MEKWEVNIEFIIQAETRREAWKLAEEIIGTKLRGFGNVHSIPHNPVSNPEQWIAVNEPLKSRIHR